MYKRIRLKTLNFSLIKSCECYRYSSTINHYTELGNAYNPKDIEEKRQDNRSNYFAPPINNNLKPFSIILPPPNITGNLHLGHALTIAIQDALTRWHRMRGFDTKWIPGIDHAGIATQVIVEKKIWKEKKLSRKDLGRDKFELEVWKWKDDKAKIITSQLNRLGSSMDLSNSIPFTMDLAHTASVTRAFINLYDSNLLYRADRLVNWSCHLQSAISDIEVERREVAPNERLLLPGYDKPVMFGQLVRFGYKLVDAEDEELVVATTRPETIPGDVAVAVHPDDIRFTKYIGRRVWHPFRQVAIPVIADDFVDVNFGTGVVKITPAHDPIDFTVAQRHKLSFINIMSHSGQLTADCVDARLIGCERFDARVRILDALAQWHLLRGIDAHALSIPICTRSGDVVEHLMRPQWFLKCTEMAQKALDVVRDGRLKIEPQEQFEKVWYGWLENTRDWCVSRQLWWGHRIPAYNCTNSSGEHCWVAANNVDDAKLKGAHQMGVDTCDVTCVQDDDVLDTWFSSALLPFSLNGWPNNCDAMDKYYPLSLMETGHDILFFWVARMVMLGIELTGKLPFDKVLLHGIICDAQGRKMSKSVGNVIAPEDIIYGASLKDLENASTLSHNSGVLTSGELVNAIKNQKKMFPDGIPQCGSDALRYTLCSHNIKSHFINFDVQECKTNKFFGNKMWQATKFTTKWITTVAESFEMSKQPHIPTLNNLTHIDCWILSRLTNMVDTLNYSIGNYELHTATSALKNFMYYEFCDVYLEGCKRGLQNYNQKSEYSSNVAIGHCFTLTTCLDSGFRTLAPFMPTLAEHLHRSLVANDKWKWITSVDYPANLEWRNISLENEIENVLEIVVGIRRLKKMFNVVGKHKSIVTLTTSTTIQFDLSKHSDLITDLAACNAIIFLQNIEDYLPMANEISDSTLGGQVQIHLKLPVDAQSALINIDLNLLDKQMIKLSKEIGRLTDIMQGERYRAKVELGMHQSNMKKIAILEEKISRIKLMKKYSCTFKQI